MTILSDGLDRLSNLFEEWGKERKLIYCAGLFDGEGYCGVYKVPGRRGWIITAGIQMCDGEGLMVFQELFGGNINHRPARTENNIPSMDWRLYSGKAVEMLKTILPWSRVKAEQIQRTMAAVEELSTNFSESSAQILEKHKHPEVLVKKEVAFSVPPSSSQTALF